jgi:Dam-replacing family
MSAKEQNTKVPTVRTRRQRLGDLGENLVVSNLDCQQCLVGKYSLAEKNTPSIDLVCGSCQSQAQVKTAQRKSAELPKSLLGGAWGPMQLRIDKKLVPDLFVVVIAEDEECRIYFLPQALQGPEMFRKREPLSSKAKSPGWTGFTIDVASAAEKFQLKAVLSLK